MTVDSAEDLTDLRLFLFEFKTLPRIREAQYNRDNRVREVVAVLLLEFRSVERRSASGLCFQEWKRVTLVLRLLWQLQRDLRSSSKDEQGCNANQHREP